MGTPDGGSGMTPRDQDVARLLARGLCDKEIARQLGIAHGTVRIHMRAVLRHTKSRNRTEAALKVAGVLQ